jgi:hypothetical protein
MDELIRELTEFLGKAGSATYAGDGKHVDPHRPGFIELSFNEGPWLYRDSYCGFFQSWGQEVIWRDGKVVWTQLYGGGMEPEHRNNEEFANETFDFLKKALGSGDKTTTFQPRGPKSFKMGEWEYLCNWDGDITKFKGNEEIRFKGKVVFTHWFFGGVCNWN